MAVLKHLASSGASHKKQPPAEASKDRLGSQPRWWNGTHTSLPSASLEAHKKTSGFHETWHLRVTDAAGAQSLHLRFHLLRSHNGFQRNCEVWATLQRRLPGSSDVQRHTLKQVFDLSEFQCAPDASAGAAPTPTEGNIDPPSPLLQFGSTLLSATSSRGTLQSKGRRLTWNLEWKPSTGAGAEFNRVPAGLQNSFQAATLHPHLSVSGTLELDEVSWVFNDALGIQEHQGGQSLPESWTWAHAWLQRADVPEPSLTGPVIEGYVEASLLRSKLIGPLRTPALHSFRIHYQGQDYRFNTLWESLRAKTEIKRHQWAFQVERGDLRFVGKLSADLKDFIGHCFEDTDGTLAYAIETGLARFELIVYRRGKLEARFLSNSGAQLEFGARKPDPYVPVLG